MSRRYHSPDLPAPGERRQLERQASHHLLQVCRHPRHEPLVLFDGAGREAACRLVDVDHGRAVVEGLSLHASAPPDPGRVLLLAVCRGPAWESALRMATELGVTAILPVVTARSGPREGNLERWNRVVASACEQCGRTWLPRLEGPRPLAAVIGENRLGPTRVVAVPGAPLLPCPKGDLALLIGPEGGLDGDEIAAALAAGFTPSGLGGSVLRVDTAVAAALARTLR